MTRGLSAVAALAVALGACARTRTPVEPSERALFKDLERQVTVAAATGWGVDRLEIDALMESVLDSACRVDTLDRRALAAWVDAEIRRRGGPVETAYARRGRDLDAVKELLVLTRIQKTLARAEELSLDCPFWLEPERPFRGRQISEHTWQLSLGGGGRGMVVQEGGRQDLSFGGAGRLLLGRTFASGNALYVGGEVGASAEFPKDAMGERTSLQLGVDIVTPVVFRRMLTNSYFEVEAGWFGRATEDDWNDLDHGVHVGLSVGARALRTRFVFPGAAFGISWGRTFADGDDRTVLRVGARVAFDLDLR